MQLRKKHHLFLLLLLLAVVLNVSLAVAMFFRQQVSFENRKALVADEFLENLHSRFNFEIALQKEINIFLNDLQKADFLLSESDFKAWKKKNFMPDKAVELVFFENGEALGVEKEFSEVWAIFIKTIKRSSYRKYRLEGDERNRLIKMLKGGVGYEAIEGKPLLLKRINRGPRYSFAAWIGSENPKSDRGAVIFINEGFLPPNYLASYLLAKHRSKDGQVACIDLFHPEFSIVPGKYFSPYEIATLASTFDIKNRKGKYLIAGREVYLSAKPDGRILVFIPWEKRPGVPFWCLALPFFWVPVLWRFASSEKSQALFSLRNLLGLVTIAGIVFPAAMTGLYWKNFLDTRLESYKIEFARRLEDNLVQIDAGHQVVLRQRKERFRRFFNLLDGQPENLQAFVDESVRLEINGFIDALLLVDENGFFYRPFSSCLSTVRGLIFYPMQFREFVIKQHFERGWVPFDLEVDYLLGTGPVDLERHIGFAENQGQVVINSLGKMAGKDIIRSYNSKKGFSSDGGGEKISSMVMGSFIESSEENPGEVLAQNLGDWVEFGFGEYKSRNFVDVIKDADGRAIFCAIIYGASLLSTHQYFNELFSRPHRWPEDVKFMAISSLPLRMCYPWPDAWKRMESLLTLLQPPRNILVDEVSINGERHLRCSYAARRCDSYILVAYVPLSRVKTEVEELRQTLYGGAAILLLILLVVFFKLSQVILEPARQLMKGVVALERKDHSHQIRLQTGDEWQQLGSTFNTALERIKELQVAHFVQTCILPSTDISAANSIFAGQTVPASDVGGDLYDAFSTHEGMTFVMGDVSGHSISAALVVNMADAAFSALVDQGLYLPQDIFSAMNSLMLEHLGRIKMMTSFAGFVDAAGNLTFSNAGQAYPYLISDDGVKVLRIAGYPLGAASRKKFKFEKILLPEKCRLLMFSDGIIEAMNEKGEPFGYERLEVLAGELGHQIDRQEFFARIYAELRKFTGSVPWGDDATLVLLDHDRRAIVNH
ncbi:MAG: PP2C family protein-serine/threonine phosphatase [Candidatus Rifleibacteriota bacterium]